MVVRQFASRTVHVMGEVRAPGTYPINDFTRFSAIAAIQRAGSYMATTAAIWDARVIRGALTTQEGYGNE